MLVFRAMRIWNLKFARTLNKLQTLGDATSANKAIKLELAATQEHLFKSWKSPESYYRKKYQGWFRFSRCSFPGLASKSYDFIWGNGESLLEAGEGSSNPFRRNDGCRCVYAPHNPLLLPSYGASLWEAPAIFFGVRSPTEYPAFYLTAILAVRLVAVGFFLSIIIKRFSRR